MKKGVLFFVSILIPMATFACPECERKQPGFLQGILHGAGPEQKWDYVIVGITSIIVLVSLFYAIKWLIKPGEKNSSHIKREVLNFD
jgi:hypothetical protein